MATQGKLGEWRMWVRVVGCGRTPPSPTPKWHTWAGWPGKPLRSSYTDTTWTGRMAFVSVRHGNHSSTLSEDTGSIGHSINSPPRPQTTCPSLKPWPVPGLFARSGPMPSPHYSPLCVILLHPTTLTHIRCSPSCPQVAIIRAKVSILSVPFSSMLHFCTSLQWRPHPLLLAPWPLPDTDLSHRFSQALLCWTCSPLCLPISMHGFAHCPDDGGSTDFWNVGKLIPVYMSVQPRRQPSSISNFIQHHQRILITTNDSDLRESRRTTSEYSHEVIIFNYGITQFSFQVSLYNIRRWEQLHYVGQHIVIYYMTAGRSDM
jgi:hypothetical protein